jgi:hypothetical protein
MEGFWMLGQQAMWFPIRRMQFKVKIGGDFRLANSVSLMGIEGDSVIILSCCGYGSAGKSDDCQWSRRGFNSRGSLVSLGETLQQPLRSQLNRDAEAPNSKGVGLSGIFKVAECWNEIKGFEGKFEVAGERIIKEDAHERW